MGPLVNALGPKGIYYRVKLAFTAGVTEGHFWFTEARHNYLTRLTRFWMQSDVIMNEVDAMDAFWMQYDDIYDVIGNEVWNELRRHYLECIFWTFGRRAKFLL